LPATLGYLLEEKNIDVKCLVSCIIAMSLSSGTKSHGRCHENNMAILSVMVSRKEKITKMSPSDLC